MSDAGRRQRGRAFCESQGGSSGEWPSGVLLIMAWVPRVSVPVVTPGWPAGEGRQKELVSLAGDRGPGGGGDRGAEIDGGRALMGREGQPPAVGFCVFLYPYSSPWPFPALPVPWGLSSSQCLAQVNSQPSILQVNLGWPRAS